MIYTEFDNPMKMRGEYATRKRSEQLEQPLELLSYGSLSIYFVDREPKHGRAG